MKRYKVDFFYLATGMEGIPMTDTWTVDADTEEEAIDKVVEEKYPKGRLTRNEDSFFRGCLSAKEL